MSKRNTNLRPEDILLDHRPGVRELAEQLRGIILAAAPEASETAYPTWHAIGYRHPRAGYFCGIFPQVESVRLIFEFGVLLPDPGRVLEGSGKQVRYVEIREGDPVPVEAIREFLEAALSLPADRKTRMWLVQKAARPAE